ncbi:PREDICTED: protein EIN4 [Ipomoea nil]|uniref:protein EIN4 n=1 Tax=Ipomoea nil TaxID=35883 RepID=UPI000900F5DC|nr:PREDICTED: protein EIN4 [Ipomoea nil]
MGAMLRWLFLGLLVSSIFSVVSAIDYLCCDDEGLFSVSNILFMQKVGDVLIAVAYFSIPIELLYFISCSNIPFKWVLVQFIAFIVLCGLTHLLNVWTINTHPSFQIIMSLTVAKILTALVSCATAITLLTLIPLLLKFKVRELFLRQNVLELDQEVGMMKKQKEASMHVRMLTLEIRKSLDKHTILYTTLVELSKTLNLQNCAVWMPGGNRTQMNLTHELNPCSAREHHSLSVNDPDVLEITKNEGVRLLKRDSVLAAASSGGSGEPGAVAAIRMPLLRGSNFKGGTPELIDTCFAILVLVFPSVNDGDSSYDELEIVEVVADQVAVALSHATVLEESQSMQEKLKERNRLLQQAKEDAMKASQARNSFQKVMNNGMRRPMHSILGLLSILQDDNLKPEQKIVIDTLVKTSTVLSTLISDAMEISAKDDGKFPVEMRPFQLHSLIREASCLVKCFAIYKGFDFSTDVPTSLPNQVMGDEKRTFQVILHMVGHLFNVSDGNGSVIFRVASESGTEDGNNKVWNTRKPSSSDDNVTIKFEIEVTIGDSQSGTSVSVVPSGRKRHNSKDVKEGLSFTMCKKLVQLMQGNIWVSSNSRGRGQGMTLILRYQKQSSIRRRIFEYRNPSEPPLPSSMFEGLQVLLADDDGVNRMVTKKLLEKLRCQVSTVSTGFECLSALGPSATSYQVIILDLHMPEMDGFEVAMRVRKFRSRNWPLIIAVTASSEDHMWERCLQVGMNGLIRKPVLLQRLAEELQRVLQRAGNEVM